MMQIDRIEDKKFMITITENEALKFADRSEVDFHLHKLLANRIGSRLIGYINESCKFPHSKRPTLELEVFKDGT